MLGGWDDMELHGLEFGWIRWFLQLANLSCVNIFFPELHPNTATANQTPKRGGCGSSLHMAGITFGFKYTEEN